MKKGQKVKGRSFHPAVTERREKIAQLRHSGMTWRQIGDEMKMCHRFARSDYYRFEKQCESVKSMHLYLDDDQKDRFAAEAKRRGLDPATLARKILNDVCQHDLFNAVLGDYDE